MILIIFPVYISNLLLIAAITFIPNIVNAQQPLTPDIMSKSHDVATLANDLIRNRGRLRDLAERETNTHYFEDDPDAVFIRLVEDTCYVVFRATVFTSIEDTLTNAEFIPVRREGLGGHTCSVHLGFWQAFIEAPDYTDEFLEKVHECRAQCDGGCNMLFGGHSQAGGIAMIASHYFEPYNPTTITLGSVAGILAQDQSDCESIDPKRVYRFETNMEVRNLLLGRSTVYDFAPRLYFDYDNLGNNYMISEDKGTAVGFGDGDRANNAWVTSWYFPAHNIRNYVSTLEHLQLLYPSANVPINGWENGEPCNEDSECRSGHCRLSFNTQMCGEERSGFLRFVLP